MNTDSFGVPASAGPGLPRRSEAKAGRVRLARRFAEVLGELTGTFLTSRCCRLRCHQIAASLLEALEEFVAVAQPADPDVLSPSIVLMIRRIGFARRAHAATAHLTLWLFKPVRNDHLQSSWIKPRRGDF